MTPENQARSIKDRLSSLSRELGAPFPKLMTEFLLSVSRCDALLKRGSLESVVKSIQPIAENDSGDGVWFRLEKTADLEPQGEYGGLRMVFRAGTGRVNSNLKKAQIIHLDIGKGDPVVPDPVEVETPFLLGGGALSWKVYPVETTVAEKLHSLLVRGSASSRAKDIFDLNLLIPQCDASHLRAALKETFRHRGEPMPEDVVAVLRRVDRTLLKMGWRSAVLDMPPVEFDRTYDEVISHLERLGL